MRAARRGACCILNASDGSSESLTTPYSEPRAARAVRRGACFIPKEYDVSSEAFRIPQSEPRAARRTGLTLLYPEGFLWFPPFFQEPIERATRSAPYGAELGVSGGFLVGHLNRSGTYRVLCILRDSDGSC